MAGLKDIEKFTGKRTDLIDKVISGLEKRVAKGQEKLLAMVVEDFVDNLDRDGDTIKNTLRNKRLIGSIDRIFKQFNASHGLESVKAISDGMGKVVDFNQQYFGLFAEPVKLAPIGAQVKTSLSSWLGIGPKGGLEENGYLSTILSDKTIQNKVRNMTLGGVVGQKGFFEMKKDLKAFIVGNSGKTGALESYYRNFVYDTFSVADRTASKITADKLKFNYAIYEGGLVKRSRIFCKKRNGKVFSREEIAEFNPTEAKPPGYNPFTDLGGYGCRHHLNWVPDVVAIALRPDLKKNIPAK